MSAKTSEANAQTVLLADPLDFEAIRDLNHMARQYRSVREGIEELLTKVKSSSQLSEPSAREAAVQWMLGNREQAEALAKRDSNSATALMILGIMAEESGNFEEALKQYQAAEKIAPSTSPCVVRQISALRQLGRIDEALERVGKLQREFGDKPNLFYNEGRCYEDLGQQQKAIECFAKGLEIQPGHPECSFRAGLLCDLRGLDDEAKRFYRNVGPGARHTYINALLNLALLHEDDDEYSEAERCCEAVLRMDPNNRRAKLFKKTARASSNMYYSPEETKQSERLEAVLRVPVTDFELSVRSRNCLQRMEIRTLGDLVKKTESEMLAYKNFGETSLREIREILGSKGLRLGMMREDAATRAAFGRGGIGKAQQEILDKTIDEIELSVRSRKCMDNMGIHTIGDLVSRSEAELATAKNFGRVSLNEIKKRLQEMGLSLKDSGLQ